MADDRHVGDREGVAHEEAGTIQALLEVIEVARQLFVEGLASGVEVGLLAGELREHDGSEDSHADGSGHFAVGVFFEPDCAAVCIGVFGIEGRLRVLLFEESADRRRVGNGSRDAFFANLGVAKHGDPLCGADFLEPVGHGEDVDGLGFEGDILFA